MPPEFSAADAERVRAGHPIWHAVIDLKYGEFEMKRLARAAVNGKLARVRELCDWHADIEAMDADGWTPLMFASAHDHVDIIRELLGRGANIETVDVHNESSLCGASLCGHLGAVHELLARGADIEAANVDGRTPLFAASWIGQVDVVRALLAAGANKRHVDDNGDTANVLAGAHDDAPPGSREAILSLLDAAP